MTILWVLLGVLQASSTLTEQVDSSELTLEVLHINDIHSYFEQTNHYSARCRDPSDQCVGGIARVYTKQKQLRDLHPKTTIFLNAGDFYQGTVWYSKLKYEPMITFGNRLEYTAMGLGNHDFDDGVDGLIPFAEKINFPLLASNINATGSKLVESKHFHRSVVKDIDGTKVGIIGYITNSTSYNFPDASVRFLDEVESIRAEAEKLYKDGVKILIALGHSGYDVDIEIAKHVPLLDLVVGGHSHTFLYTSKGEDDVPEDKIQGPYPTYVETASGDKIIPVVQAKAYTKYLGHLTLNFDSNGELKRPIESEGVSFAQPYLLDGSVKQDEETLNLMKPYQDQLTEFKTVLGKTTVLMKSESDSAESNIGNAVTDSMIDDETKIAIVNNGGIRGNFELGDITGEDIFLVLPFQNTIDKLMLKGAQLKKALEKAASNIDNNDPDKYPGFGLQFSGMKLKIVASDDNSGNRIESFQIKNSAGDYEDADMDKTYTINIGSFLAPAGRQKHLREIFDDVEIVAYSPGTKKDYDAFVEYVKKSTPLSPAIEGRLSVQFVKTSSAFAIGSSVMVMISLLQIPHLF